MAVDTPSTRARAAASGISPIAFPEVDALGRVEEVSAQLAEVEAVLGAASEEITFGAITDRGQVLIYAAERLLSSAMGSMSAAIAQGYAERQP